MRLVWRRRSAHGPDHELIWLAVSLASFALGGAWLALGLPWPRCPFHAVTGWPCLTCGATRASIAFLHGDFLSALRWNPLGFAVLCALVVFDLYAAIVLIGRMPRLRAVDWSAGGKNVVRIAAIGLLALNWAYLLAHYDRF
jgi:Protein of unknown function (DUF2752)